MRKWQLALVAVAVLTAVVAEAGNVAVAAATGGTVTWFPPVERHPLGWTAGLAAVTACVSLLGQWVGRRHDRRLAQLVPAVQRPERWVVGRPEEVDQIVAALRPGGTAGITTAMHGAGGFGKTVVAKMVRSDRRILRRFGKRVYWVTLGRDTGAQSLTGLVNDLIAQLEPNRPVTFTHARQAGEHLAAVLASGPRRLLVLDDVWTEEQLAVFPVAGRCARLVTTRNPSLAAGVGTRVTVDRMSEHQASEVLSKGLRPPLAPLVATGLIAETGRWPLLLRLVNKILTDSARFQPDVTEAAEDLLHRLRRNGGVHLDELTGTVSHQLDVSDPDQRHKTVRATIEASTSLLDPGQHARFAELAVFAEDDTIPVTLAAALWQVTGGLDEAAASALCARLADLALLTPVPSSDGGAVTMHDVIRDFLREELGDTRLLHLHQLLLDVAAEGLPAAAGISGEGTATAWWDLPAQARYLQDHLIEHMLATGRLQDAEAVATDLRWAAARLEQAGPAAPYADLAMISTPLADQRRRLLAQVAHLLAATDPPYSQTDILCSRVSHDPGWGPQARRLQANRTQAALINDSALPDLPDPALRRTLGGHSGWVLAAAVAPDGTWLATASDDKTARIWDAVTGQQRAVLTGHTGVVRAVAIAPDGTWLATASDDETARIWDVATGQERAVLTGHKDVVSAVAIAPDGTWLATYGHDRTERIWDAATGQKRAVRPSFVRRRVGRPRYSGPVAAAAVAPDGTWLATVGEDRTVRVWDAVTGQQRAVLTGHLGTVWAVAIAADGTWLATASDDQTARIWDVATGQQRAVLTGHTDWVRAVAVAPDGTWLATASWDMTVRVWDAATGQQRAVLTGHRDIVSAVAVAQDGTWLATASDDTTTRIWDASTRFISSDGHTGYGAPVAAVAIAPDGTWAATVGSDKTARIWDVATGQQRAVLTGHTDWVRAVAVAPDGTWLATGSWDETARIWDLATGQQRAVLTGHTGIVSAVAVAQDGTWLATVGEDRTVRVWDAATGQQRAVLTRHLGSVWAVAVAADGKWLATASDDKTARTWDAATGQQRAVRPSLSRRLAGYISRSGSMTAVAIAPDGTWLATASDDKTARIWDAATGQQRAVLTGHTDRVTAVAIAPNGTWLATASDDRTLRIWDQTTGNTLAVMRVDGRLQDCKWSPCGQSLAAGGEGGLYYFTFKP